MQKLLMLLAAGVAAGVIAAGCGGDDDEALAKDEFIAQADEICMEGDKAIDEGAQDLFQERPSKADQIEFVEDTMVPETQSQIDAIRELTPPEEDQEQVTALLDAADEGIATVESDPEAAIAGNENPLAEASQLARAYGLEVCGAGG